METPNSSVIDEGDEYASMSASELAEFVHCHRWTYARTMPQWPHEYMPIRWPIPSSQPSSPSTYAMGAGLLGGGCIGMYEVVCLGC